MLRVTSRGNISKIQPEHRRLHPLLIPLRNCEPPRDRAHSAYASRLCRPFSLQINGVYDATQGPLRALTKCETTRPAKKHTYCSSAVRLPV